MMADRLSDIAAGGDSTKKLIKVMDADLGCCLDCAIEYHRNRAAWLRSNPIAALPKRLYKRDVSRLTRQLQDFSSRCDDAMKKSTHSTLDPDDIKPSLCEVLIAPALLWNEVLCAHFAKALHGFRQLGGKINVTERLPGLYMLLVYPDLNISVRAWELVQDAGELNEDDYLDIEEVVNWIMCAVEYGPGLASASKLSVVDCYSAHDSNLTFMPLCVHLRQSPGHQANFFWLGVERLLKILSPNALSHGLLATHPKVVDGLLNVLKSQELPREHRECFWVVLRCIVFMLHVLDSSFWQYCSEEPSSVLETVALHTVYQKEMHRLSKLNHRRTSGSSSDTHRQCTFGWFIPFMLSVVKFGTMADNAFSSTVRFLCKIWGVVFKNVNDRAPFNSDVFVEGIVNDNQLAIECCLAVVRMLKASIDNNVAFLARKTCKDYWLPLVLKIIQYCCHRDPASSFMIGSSSRVVMREVTALLQQLLLIPGTAELNKQRTELLELLFTKPGALVPVSLFSGWQVKVTCYITDLLTFLHHSSSSPKPVVLRPMNVRLQPKSEPSDCMPAVSSKQPGQQTGGRNADLSKSNSLPPVFIKKEVEVIEVLDSDSETEVIPQAQSAELNHLPLLQLKREKSESPVSTSAQINTLNTGRSGQEIKEEKQSIPMVCDDVVFPPWASDSESGTTKPSSTACLSQTKALVVTPRQPRLVNTIASSDESDDFTKSVVARKKSQNKCSSFLSSDDDSSDHAPVVLSESWSDNIDDDDFKHSETPLLPASCPPKIPVSQIQQPTALHHLTIKDASQKLVQQSNSSLPFPPVTTATASGGHGVPSVRPAPAPPPLVAQCKALASPMKLHATAEKSPSVLVAPPVHGGAPHCLTAGQEQAATHFDFPIDAGSNASKVQTLPEQDNAREGGHAHSLTNVHAQGTEEEPCGSSMWDDDGNGTVFPDPPALESPSDESVSEEVAMDWAYEPAGDFGLEADMLADFEASQQSMVPEGRVLPQQQSVPSRPVAIKEPAPAKKRSPYSLYCNILVWNCRWFLFPAIDVKTGLPFDTASIYPKDTDMRRIPLAFDSVDDYISAFESMLRQEVWCQISESVTALQKAPPTDVFLGVLKIGSKAPCEASQVREFSVEGKLLSSEVNKRAPFSERDLVVLFTFSEQEVPKADLFRGMCGKSSVKKQRVTTPVFYPEGCAKNLAAVEPIFGVVRMVDKRVLRSPSASESVTTPSGSVVSSQSLMLSVTFIVHRNNAMRLQSVCKVYVVKLLNLTASQRSLLGLQSLVLSPLHRDIVCPRGPEYFSTRSPPISHDKIWKARLPFNPSQMEMIANTCSAIQEPYLHPRINLLQGPPGTGKTHMLVGLIVSLLSLNFPGRSTGRPKILLCGPSHASVDEIVCRLNAEGVLHNPSAPSSHDTGQFHLVRTGACERINPVVQPYSLERKVREKYEGQQTNTSLELDKQIEDISGRLEQAQVDCAIMKFNFTNNFSRDRQGTEKQLKELEAKRDSLQRDVRALRWNKKNSGRSHKSYKHIEEAVYKEVLGQADIVVSTLSGAGYDPLVKAIEQLNKRMFFTCVIVDEAAQCTEPDVLIPLQHGSSKLVLVGDPCQLPATLKSRDAERYQYSRSLFERFYRFFEQDKHFQSNPVRVLNEQYRMHPEICTFSSQRFYRGKLQTSRFVLERPRFPFSPMTALDLSRSKEDSRSAGRIFNSEEVNAVVMLCQVLLTSPSRSLSDRSIGIITPYREQVERIKARLNERKFGAIEVLSVDGFQGREKDVIILSCVRAQGSSPSIGFVSHVQRLNVALTRARHSLIVVGHFKTLMVSKDWKSFYTHVEKAGNLVSLTDVCHEQLKGILTRGPGSQASTPTSALNSPMDTAPSSNLTRDPRMQNRNLPAVARRKRSRDELEADCAENPTDSLSPLRRSHPPASSSSYLASASHGPKSPVEIAPKAKRSVSFHPSTESASRPRSLSVASHLLVRPSSSSSSNRAVDSPASSVGRGHRSRHSHGDNPNEIHRLGKPQRRCSTNAVSSSATTADLMSPVFVNSMPTAACAGIGGTSHRAHSVSASHSRPRAPSVTQPGATPFTDKSGSAGQGASYPLFNQNQGRRIAHRNSTETSLHDASAESERLLTNNTLGAISVPSTIALGGKASKPKKGVPIRDKMTKQLKTKGHSVPRLST